MLFRSQDVANTVWALATLGWQAGEGAMRGVLEGAAVWVAPSMNAQAVANTVWVLATLGWQADVELAVILRIRLRLRSIVVGHRNVPHRACRSFCRPTWHRSFLG